MKKITELLKAIDNHGLAIFSNSVATHIFEKNEFNYASTIDLSEYLNNQNNYAIMIICSDSISYLSIVKRKMDFPDGTVAVTSYGISSICKYSFENLQIKTKKSIDHTQLIEPKNLRLIIKKIYTDINDDGKEKIVELIKKYIHLSGPTFESEGNELFADDAEHIGVRIFRSRKDPIVRPLFDINEDDMIYKDLYSSNNGELIEDSVGHVRYITEQGRWLDVVNVNRKAGEKALGVDLIYYLREYRSIVMLQYKRIKDKTGTYYASSDGNYNSEIERMARTRDLLTV